MSLDVMVFDDVLADPEAYRAMALAQPFTNVTIGEATFHGIARCPVPDLTEWMTAALSMTPQTTFFRKSPFRQEEPNYIHTDQDMGAWTGILYLTPNPASGDGTTFWKRTSTGETMSTGETVEELLPEWLAWRDLTQWEPYQMVEATFNRLVVFPAPLFHSRSLFENYGQTTKDARLIQVCFGGSDVRRY